MNAKEQAQSFLNAPSTMKVDGAEAVYLLGELLKEYDYRIEERDSFRRVAERLEGENRTLRQVVTDNADNFDAGKKMAVRECLEIVSAGCLRVSRDQLASEISAHFGVAL